MQKYSATVVYDYWTEKLNCINIFSFWFLKWKGQFLSGVHQLITYTGAGTMKIVNA